MEISTPNIIISNKLTIAVLDDMYHRIQWLKDNFSDKSEIFWASTVNNFLFLIEHINPDLLILDHDLDILNPNPFNNDKDGNNGTTLALKIKYFNKNVPILIWSQNGRASVNMFEILNKKGYTNVKRIQFGFDLAVGKYINQIFEQT